MKLILVLLSVMCLALLVQANAGADERITDQEIQELINDYKSLTAEVGPNAQVS